MKKSISITLGTLLVPTMMLGAGMASAGEQEAGATDQATAVNGGDNFITTRPDSAFYADQLIGTNVRGPSEDEDFGSVNDIIIGDDGQIEAVVVGVGGFLGMGDHDVAISWDALDITRQEGDEGTGMGWFGDDNYVIRTDITREELEQAPEYQRDNDNN